MRHVQLFEAEDLHFRAAHPWGGARTQAPRRPRNRAASRMLRVAAWLAVLACVVAGIAVVMPTLTTAGEGIPFDLLLMFCGAGALATGLFRVVRGIRRGQRWARLVGISCAVSMLVGFPVGTAAGCHVLWRLLFHWEAAGDSRP